MSLPRRTRRASAFYGVGRIASTPDGLLTVQPSYFQLLDSSTSTWTKRWFTLSNNYMLVQGTEHDAESTAETVDLRNAEELTELCVDGKFELILTMPTRLIRARANSQHELGIWMRALRQRQTFTFEQTSDLGPPGSPATTPGTTPTALRAPSPAGSGSGSRRGSSSSVSVRRVSVASPEAIKMVAKLAAAERRNERLASQLEAGHAKSTAQLAAMHAATARAEASEEQRERMAAELREALRTAEHAQSAVRELRAELATEREAMRNAVEHAHRQHQLLNQQQREPPSSPAQKADNYDPTNTKTLLLQQPPTSSRKLRTGSQMRQAIEAFKRADTDENGLVGVQGVLAALLPPSNTVTDAERLIAEFGEEGANVLDRPRFIRMQKALWAREDEAEEQRAAAAAADAIRNEDSSAPGAASGAAPSAATAARIGAMQAEIDELRSEIDAYENARLELESAFEAEEIATLEQRQRADGFERRAEWLAAQLAEAEDERRAMGSKLLDGMVKSRTATSERNTAVFDAQRALEELRADWLLLETSNAALVKDLEAARDSEASVRRELKRRVTLGLVAEHDAVLRAKAGTKREERVLADAAGTMAELVALRAELEMKRRHVGATELAMQRRVEAEADERVGTVRKLVVALEVRLVAADALNAQLRTDLDAMTADAAAVRSAVVTVETQLATEQRERAAESDERAVKRRWAAEAEAELRRAATTEALAAAHGEVQTLTRQLASVRARDIAALDAAAERERDLRAALDATSAELARATREREREGARLGEAKVLAAKAEQARTRYVLEGMRSEINTLRKGILHTANEGSGIHIDRCGVLSFTPGESATAAGGGGRWVSQR